jgi:hypothetical protein
MKGKIREYLFRAYVDADGQESAESIAAEIQSWFREKTSMRVSIKNVEQYWKIKGYFEVTVVLTPQRDGSFDELKRLIGGENWLSMPANAGIWKQDDDNVFHDKIRWLELREVPK